MDELDLTEKTPRAFETGPVGPPLTMPIEKIDIEPLATERAADGTRTRLPTAPPPIPARAKRVSKPPPIPTAAFEKALPEPEIPLTIEPVVTRRSGTIPPIPAAALRRPPAVPPIDAPSVEVSASAIAPMDASSAVPMPSAAMDAFGVASAVPEAPVSAAASAPPTTMLVGPGVAEPDLGSLWPDIAPPSASAPSSSAVSRVAMASSMAAATPPLAAPAHAVPPSPVVASSHTVVPSPVVASSHTVVPSPVVAPAHAVPPPRARSARESAAVATLPEWPILDSAPAPVVDEPIEVPLPALPAPSSEWLHPKVATPPLVHEDPEIVATTYFERDEAPAPFVSRRYLAAAGVGGLTLVAIIALAMRGHGDDTKVTTPAKRTHTHAITKAPAIATARPAGAAPTDTAAGATKVASSTDTPPDVTTATTPPTASSEPATMAATGGHALAEIPISSWPQGATVTLVDDGTAKIIGRTPLTASLDPSRSYDVVLAVSGRPTTVRHLDPSTTHELAVDLDPDPAAASSPKHVAVAEPHATGHVIEPTRATANVATRDPDRTTAMQPTHTTQLTHTAALQATHTATTGTQPTHTATTGTQPMHTAITGTQPTHIAITGTQPTHTTHATATQPGHTSAAITRTAGTTPATARISATATKPTTAKSTARPAQLGKLAPVDFDTPATASTGTLQVQSRPPCEILIDGTPTHLTTPQRAIALSPGAHAVTLINTHDKIKKTIAVHIEAKRATKLAHDFTAQ